jgi:hypothetical protein
MELLKSIRLFLWGIIKRIYWILPTLILDPFDLAKRIFNINYNMPQWSVWTLFVLGCLIACILTYHELRLKTVASTQLSWIEKYKKEQQGKLPPIPDYLMQLVTNYTKGEPIRKDIQLQVAERGFWQNLLPSQQEDLLTLAKWLGQDPRDYAEKVKRNAPPFRIF